MMKNENMEKGLSYLLVIMAFCMPLLLTASIISLVLLILLRLSSQDQRQLIVRSIRSHPILLLLPLFYLWHIFGLIWTENYKYAGLDLQIKAAFLLFPLFAGTMKISEKNFRLTLWAFVWGCVSACLVLLIHAMCEFSETGKISYFFYIDYSSLLMHPTYISMYINIAILFLVYLMYTITEPRNLVFFSAAFLFLFIQLILLSARTAQAVALLTFILSSYYFLRNGSFLNMKRAHFVLILAMTTGSYFILQHLNNRYSQVENAIVTAADAAPANEYNSTTGRIEIWKESMDLLRENWILGTGTGDVKDELMKTYQQHNFHYALDKKLNSHNQFLQTLLALGAPGLLLLLMLVLHPFLNIKGNEWPVFAFFSLVIILNAMTEAILEVQRGAFFFAYMYSLFKLKEINTFTSA